jgi:uncharacterized protein
MSRFRSDVPGMGSTASGMGGSKGAWHTQASPPRRVTRRLADSSYDPWFYILAIPAVLLTGISKGGFASGAGNLRCR